MAGASRRYRVLLAAALSRSRADELAIERLMPTAAQGMRREL